MGRADGQVKIRGFRVELAEVEGVVREFPGVTNATVVAFDKPSGGKYVAVYVVSGEEVGPAELSAFIRERKPPQSVRGTEALTHPHEHSRVTRCHRGPLQGQGDGGVDTSRVSGGGVGIPRSLTGGPP